ncbi:hypothetical protein COOONC_28147 [Cooperia oncophora]
MLTLLVDNISRDKIYICHSHVVRAAQYLCAEVTISGGRLSYDTDLKGRKASAYFTTADIPPHLVEVINGTSSKEVVTARDVWTFVNGALMKYHGTTAWPSDYQEEDESEKAVPNIDTDGPPPLSKAEDELGAEDGVDMVRATSGAVPISAKVPRIDANQPHHPPIVQQGPCPSESACERLLDHVTVEKAGGEVDGNQETSGLSTLDGEVKAEVTDDAMEDDNYETVRSYIIRQLKLPDPPSHPPAPRENLNPTETELLD